MATARISGVSRSEQKTPDIYSPMKEMRKFWPSIELKWMENFKLTELI